MSNPDGKTIVVTAASNRIGKPIVLDIAKASARRIGQPFIVSHGRIIQ